MFGTLLKSSIKQPNKPPINITIIPFNKFFIFIPTSKTQITYIIYYLSLFIPKKFLVLFTRNSLFKFQLYIITLLFQLLSINFIYLYLFFILIKIIIYFLLILQYCNHINLHKYMIAEYHAYTLVYLLFCRLTHF